MTPPDILDRLRAMARRRKVSLASVVREALEEKAREGIPAPRSLGAGRSGRRNVSSLAGVGRTEPR